MTSLLRIDVWSDIACPWCYVGKRRLEAALQQFPQRDQSPLARFDSPLAGPKARFDVQVVWRSFQLDPAAPRSLPSDTGYAERLAKKYGTTPAQGAAMIERMTQTAALDGIAMDFQHIRPGNTFDAHRLLHWAKSKQRQDALKERLFRGYLCEGRAIGEHDVLLSLVGELGLDVDEAAGVLAGDAFAADVRADRDQARDLGIDGVPFFVIGQRYGVSGAQSPETLLSVLTKWRDENSPAGLVSQGEACGPDGCGP